MTSFYRFSSLARDPSAPISASDRLLRSLSISLRRSSRESQRRSSLPLESKSLASYESSTEEDSVSIGYGRWRLSIIWNTVIIQIITGVSFTPREAGEHLITVKRDGKLVPKAPFKIKVDRSQVSSRD